MSSDFIKMHLPSTSTLGYGTEKVGEGIGTTPTERAINLKHAEDLVSTALNTISAPTEEYKTPIGPIDVPSALSVASATGNMGKAVGSSILNKILPALTSAGTFAQSRIAGDPWGETIVKTAVSPLAYLGAQKIASSKIVPAQIDKAAIDLSDLAHNRLVAADINPTEYGKKLSSIVPTIQIPGTDITRPVSRLDAHDIKYLTDTLGPDWKKHINTGNAELAAVANQINPEGRGIQSTGSAPKNYVSGSPAETDKLVDEVAYPKVEMLPVNKIISADAYKKAMWDNIYRGLNRSAAGDAGIISENNAVRTERQIANPTSEVMKSIYDPETGTKMIPMKITINGHINPEVETALAYRSQLLKHMNDLQSADPLKRSTAQVSLGMYLQNDDMYKKLLDLQRSTATSGKMNASDIAGQTLSYIDQLKSHFLAPQNPVDPLSQARVSAMVPFEVRSNIPAVISLKDRSSFLDKLAPLGSTPYETAKFKADILSNMAGAAGGAIAPQVYGATQKKEKK